MENAPDLKQAERAETAPLSAKQPMPATRRDAVLSALRAGDRITIIDAINRGWGWSIAGDIFALRKRGHPIVTTEIQHGKAKIASYWMEGARHAE